jgi:hypothetical protein
MKMTLTLQQRLGILRDINSIREMTILENIICTEISNLVMIRSQDIIDYDIKVDGDQYTWNLDKDLDSPKVIQFNQMHMEFLDSKVIKRVDNEVTE